MSSSDKVKDGFQPINLSSLEVFDEEKISRDKRSDPDWDKFKIFFEELKSDKNDADSFKALFEQEETKKEEEIIFEQFGEDKAEADSDRKVESGKTGDKDAEDVIAEKDKSEPDSIENDLQASGLESGGNQVDENDNQPDHNQGYDQGYEQGFEKVKKDGYTKGLEQGEKDGHEQGVKEGYSEGYANGEAEATKEVNLKFIEKVEEFEKILLQLDNAYQELATRYEEKIISLICSIAEKVVLAKVEIDDGIIKETILDALKALPEPEDITLSVSEEDYEYIEMVKEDLFDSIKSLKSVFVKSDASVERGGCRIETKEGYIETDIESKLEKIFLSVKGQHKI